MKLPWMGVVLNTQKILAWKTAIMLRMLSRVGAGVVATGLFVAQPVLAFDLLDVYELALQNDALLAASGYSQQAQKESLAQAKSLFYPTVALSASAAQNSIDAVYTPYNWATGTYDEIKLNTRNRAYAYGITIVQPLFHYDHYQVLKMVKANNRKADLEHRHARQGLILRVAESYFSVLRAQEHLRIATKEVQALETQMSEIKNLYRSGLISSTDLAEGQAALDTAKVNQIVIEKDMLLLLEGLYILTGQPVEAIEPLKRVDLPLLAEGLAVWESEALADNLQIKAAELLIESLRYEAKRFQAEYYPKVDLGVSYYKNTVESRSIAVLDSDQDHSNQSATLTVTLPLDISGATRSRIQQTNYRILEAEQHLQQQKRMVLAEVRNQHRQATTQKMRIEARIKSIASSEEAYTATKQGYLLGSRTLPELLSAQRALFIAHGDLIQAQLDSMLAQLRLKFAAGRLIPDDIKQLNAFLGEADV